MLKHENSEAQQCANTNRASMSETVCKETNMNIVAKSDYNFHGVELVPTRDMHGVWFTSSNIASALKYANSRAVTMIYNKYSDEFSTGMTQVLEVSTSGNYRKKVRVFSLRGAHLIAMFARTPVAKEFRHWVLDILDREVGSAGADRLPTKFHQRVLLYLNENGQVKDTYPLTEDQVVMSFDAFVSYFRKKGWIVAPRDEVAKGIMGAIQVLS
ncbi:Bro-N domain-containing protein [Salmonella enterica]|nr:Bro-N domain-containing protein [Salmonella enterica]